MKTRKIIYPVLALFLGLLVALVMAEAVCKVLEVRKVHKMKRMAGKISLVSDIPGVRYEMRPNISTITPGFKEFKEVVHINNLGFRGPPVMVEKPADTYRIAILSDSITFGRTLHEDRVFSAVLQKNMDARGYDKKIEVINAGLSGRDTWEEYALLKHKVLDLPPDLVVLQICLNDHVQLPFPKKDTQRGVFGELAWYDYSSLLALLDKKVKGFRKHHVKWVRKLGLDRRSQERVIMDHYIDPKQMLNVEPHWDEWSRVLLAFNQLAREHGADVLYLISPINILLREQRAETMPVLSRFLEEHEIPYIDMIGAFSASEHRVLRDYTHPNVVGNRIVAEELEAYIAAHLLKPASR